MTIEEEMLKELHAIAALEKQRPGEVNGAWGKTFTFLRQIQGAVLLAGILAGGSWMYEVNNRLISIETKVGDAGYIIPGTVPINLYNSEMKGLHMRNKMLEDRIAEIEARSAERNKQQQVQIDHVRELFEQKF